MSVKINDLPFDFEVDEDDLPIDKKAKRAAGKDIKENWVTAGTNEDIDVALWKATPSVTSRSSSGVSTTIDHLCTLTYDFSSYSGSGTWTKSTTSFNATSLTQGEYLFVTLKRTSGTDGSNYHVHSTVTFDY